MTGRKFDKRDTDKLSDLADLLILQLDAAAKKTSGVSSVAPFLVEICRRKFLNVAGTAKASKVKPDTIGTPNLGSYEIKPLDEAGRETALAQLQEFAGDEFLQDFRKWYTEEDWGWLTKELETERREK